VAAKWRAKKGQTLGRLLATLPAGERVKRYREIAAEAFRHAATTKDEVLKAEYLTLASLWQVLAIELEHSSGIDRSDLDFSESEGAKPDDAAGK
jgi:hypothetical protein